MEERYNTTLGFYEPSVFHLYTRGTGKVSALSHWDTQQASTFLHEYVHFLQDITTVKGLQNLYITGEYLRLVTNKVKESNYKVSRPIIPFIAGYNVGNNWQVSYFTMGETDNKAIKYISFTRDKSKSVKDDITQQKIDIGRILVSCLCIDGSTKQYCFGTIQVMEGMAKMIQETAFPLSPKLSPYNPYYIAIDLANDIMNGLGSNIPTMIAIFDYALQSSNPGWAFVNYIEEKKRKGYNSVSLTHDIVYQDLNNAAVQSHTLGITTFKESYLDMQNMAKGVIRDYTGGIWLFKNLEVWYNSLIKRGMIVRETTPYFFVSLCGGGDIRENGIFRQILSIFGTPIVTNGNHVFEFLKPNNIPITRDELMQVYAMMQIHRVFKSKGHFTCPLRKYCQSLSCVIKKQRVDIRCIKAPWKKMRSFNRCLFNIWWKYKGFKNVEFV